MGKQTGFSCRSILALGQAIGSLHRLPGLSLVPQHNSPESSAMVATVGAVQTGRQYGVFAQLFLGQYVFCFHPVFDPGECQSYHWEAKRHIQESSEVHTPKSYANSHYYLYNPSLGTWKTLTHCWKKP